MFALQAYPKCEYMYWRTYRKSQQDDGNVVKIPYLFHEADGSLRRVAYKHSGFNRMVHNIAIVIFKIAPVMVEAAASITTTSTRMLVNVYIAK